MTTEIKMQDRKFNPNGSVKASAVENLQQIRAGKGEWTLSANLQAQYNRLRVNQVLVLPSGQQYLRVRRGWLAVQ